MFCLPEYVNGSAPPEKVRFLRPAIDPLTVKNQQLHRSRASEILAGLGIDPGRPLISQVSRFDPWKDPLGVMDAYRIAKRQSPFVEELTSCPGKSVSCQAGSDVNSDIQMSLS